jgi:hypothetical protein
MDRACQEISRALTWREVGDVVVTVNVKRHKFRAVDWEMTIHMA